MVARARLEGRGTPADAGRGQLTRPVARRRHRLSGWASAVSPVLPGQCKNLTFETNLRYHDESCQTHPLSCKDRDLKISL